MDDSGYEDYEGYGPVDNSVDNSDLEGKSEFDATEDWLRRNDPKHWRTSTQHNEVSIEDISEEELHAGQEILKEPTVDNITGVRQVVLDTETTGFSAKRGHRIVEIGATELIDGKPTGRTYQQYLNPGRKSDPGAYKVHKLEDKFLAKQPKFEEVAEDFLGFVDGADVVIHNAKFDLEHLNNELKLAGIDDKLEDSSKVVDTLELARRTYGGLSGNSLDNLAEKFGVDLGSRADSHGALIDTNILADVYGHLVKAASEESEDVTGSNPTTQLDKQQKEKDLTDSFIEKAQGNKEVLANDYKRMFHKDPGEAYEAQKESILGAEREGSDYGFGQDSVATIAANRELNMDYNVRIAEAKMLDPETWGYVDPFNKGQFAEVREIAENVTGVSNKELAAMIMKGLDREEQRSSDITHITFDEYGNKISKSTIPADQNFDAKTIAMASSNLGKTMEGYLQTRSQSSLIGSKVRIVNPEDSAIGTNFQRTEEDFIAGEVGRIESFNTRLREIVTERYLVPGAKDSPHYEERVQEIETALLNYWKTTPMHQRVQLNKEGVAETQTVERWDATSGKMVKKEVVKTFPQVLPLPAELGLKSIWGLVPTKGNKFIKSDQGSTPYLTHMEHARALEAVGPSERLWAQQPNMAYTFIKRSEDSQTVIEELKDLRMDFLEQVATDQDIASGFVNSRGRPQLYVGGNRPEEGQLQEEDDRDAAALVGADWIRPKDDSDKRPVDNSLARISRELEILKPRLADKNNDRTSLLKAIEAANYRNMVTSSSPERQEAQYQAAHQRALWLLAQKLGILCRRR